MAWASTLRGSAALLASWGVVGCIETVRVGLEVEAGDLVILVSVDGDGTIQEVQSGIGGGALPELRPNDDERAFATVLPRSSLVGPDGAPLSDAVRRSLTVGIGPYPVTGCARCLFDSPFSPMVVHGGSTCPVPAFSDWRALDGSGTGTFSARPWIAAPGDCACADLPVPGRPPEVDYMLLDPPDFFAPEAVAVAADGTVGLFAEQRSAIVKPDGTKVVRDDLFAGPVLAIAPALDGSFWVASHEGGGVADARRDRVAALGTELAILDSQAALQLRPVSARAIDGSSYFFGRDIDLRALAQVCGLDGIDSRCRMLGAEAFNEAGEELVDGAVLADGAFVLLNRQGLVVFERRIDETDDPQPIQTAVDRGSFRVAGGGEVRFRAHSTPLGALSSDLAFFNFRFLVPIPNGAVACASSGNFTALIRVRVDRTAALDGALPELTSLGYVLGRCMAASISDTDAAKVRFSLEGGAYEVDTLGRLERYDDPSLPPIESYQRPTPSQSLAVGALGDVYLSSGGGPYRSIHTSPRIGGPVVAILGRPDDELVVEPHRIRRFVGAEQEVWSGPFGISVQAATLDPGGGVWLSAGRRLYFVEPDGGTPALELSLAGSSTITALAYVAPGRFLALTDDEQPLLVADRRAQLFSILTDDPSTEAVEISDPCGVVEALSVSDGVGWFSGCQGQLYRAHLYAEPPVLERVSFARGSQLQYGFEIGEQPPKLTALTAVCPDRVYIAADGSGDNEAERGRLWHLAPESAFGDPAPGPAPNALGGLTLRDLPQSGGVTQLDSNSPIAVIFGPSRLDVVFRSEERTVSGSIHAFGARARTRFADPPSAGGGGARGLLVGTSEGRLYRQVPAAGR